MATNIDAIVGVDSDEDVAAMSDMQREEYETPEETESAAPEPESSESPPPSADEEPEAAEPEKEPTTIPYGVLREERDKRQALEEQIAQQTAQINRMEQTFQTVLERAQRTVEPEIPVPDFDLDPDAYTKHKLETIEQRLEREEQERNAQRESQKKDQQARQFLDMYANSAREFAKETPDAGEAYKFAMEAMDNELKLRGIVDPTERARVLEREEEQIVVRAFQQGANPAKRIYELAQARGYKPGKKTETEDDKLARLARTQDASTSLADSGGDGGNPPVTLARLAELDGDEFDKAFEKARSSGALG